MSTTAVPQRVQNEWAAELAAEKREADVAEHKSKALAARVEQAQETIQHASKLDAHYDLLIEALTGLTATYDAIHNLRGPVEHAHSVLIDAGLAPDPLPPRLSSRTSADHELRAVVDEARLRVMGDI